MENMQKCSNSKKNKYLEIENTNKKQQQQIQ